MSDHDESLMDKVKGALGFGDDRDRRTDDTVRDDTVRDDAALDTDARTDGWAGVDEALGDDTVNRPAGPDYGAEDTTDTTYGADDRTATTYGADDRTATTYGADDRTVTTYGTTTGTTTGTEAVEDDVEVARRDEGLPR